MSRAFLVVVLLAPATAAAGNRCVVRGSSVKLEQVVVSSPHDDPFSLDVTEVPIAATIPTRCGAPLDLDIGGSLAFKAKRDLVWLMLNRDITSADGVVTAKRGAQLIHACMKGDKVIGNAILDAEDVLDGERKDADAWVASFEVPCDALTLDGQEMSDTDMLGEITYDDDTPMHFWQLRNDATDVMLYAEPRYGAKGQRIVTGCAECQTIHELAEKKSFVLVEIAGYGVRARGWMAKKRGIRLPDDFTPLMGGVMCLGEHRGGEFFGVGQDNSVVRTGTIRGGTSVYRDAGKTPWAVFAKDTPIKVRITPGKEWAVLEDVPGILGPVWQGHVHLEALKLDPAKP